MSNEIPAWESDFGEIAKLIARRSKCSRRQVGAVIVGPKYDLRSSGYNGTPFGAKNCDEGGCPRCAGDVPSGSSLELCLCVHAEANAIYLSTRRGSATEGCSMVVTCRPCLSCLKACIQAGIRRITFVDEYAAYDAETEAAYKDLVETCGITLLQMPINS